MLLIKGRTEVAAAPAEGPTGGPYAIEDPSDPGKPAFRLGYVELQVEDGEPAADRRGDGESRGIPAGDRRAGAGAGCGCAGASPSQSEVTLWAVDYGVLSLTGYRTPDVLGSVYVHKALQVINTDSRQRIVSRRVLTPKGDAEGGGGGVDGGQCGRTSACWRSGLARS